MKISEIITDKYKLRIPPTVYYELLADVVEAEVNAIPRERIEQMVAEIEKMQITSGVTGQGAWNECLHYVLETIREYTKEQNND